MEEQIFFYKKFCPSIFLKVASDGTRIDKSLGFLCFIAFDGNGVRKPLHFVAILENN